jgi:hypothetical protein
MNLPPDNSGLHNKSLEMSAGNAPFIREDAAPLNIRSGISNSGVRLLT